MTGPLERHSASITITANTTLQQLETFTQQMGANEKLRGIRHDDGSITLYSTDKKAKVLDKFTKTAADRSQAARDAISMVMRNVHNNQPELLSNVGQLSKLAASKTDRSMNTDTLSQMMGLLKPKPTETPTIAQLPNGGQSVKTAVLSLVNKLDLASQNGTAVSTDVNGKTKITNPGIKQDISVLANAILTGLRDPSVSSKFPDFALAKGDVLRDDVVNMLRNELGPMLGKVIGQNVLQTIGTLAVETALGKLQPNQFMMDGSLSMLGRTFVEGRVLGEGAFGKVIEFVPRDGGEPVAVKFTKIGQRQTEAMAFDSAVKEYTAQKKAEGTGDPNVLHSHGLVRVGDGTLAVISEIAPKGNAFEMLDNLKRMVADGVITKEQGMLAAMTLIQDMTRGLAHMHANGVAHVDFKPQNVFIDKDGVGKVADFGTGTESRVGSQEIFAPIDAPYWQAPEVLASKENAIKSDVSTNDLNAKAFDNLKYLFANPVMRGDALPQTFNINRSFVDNANDSAYADQLDTQFDGGSIDPQRYDAFALGVSILNFFKDSTFVPGGQNQFMTQDLKELLEFYDKGVDVIGDHDGAVYQTTGYPEIDNLINQLMKTDPSKRMTVDQALTNHAFSDPRIGSDEARALVLAITENNPAKARLAAVLI